MKKLIAVAALLSISLTAYANAYDDCLKRVEDRYRNCVDAVERDSSLGPNQRSKAYATCHFQAERMADACYENTGPSGRGAPDGIKGIPDRQGPE